MRPVVVAFVVYAALLVPDEAHAVHVPRLLDHTLSLDEPLLQVPGGLQLTLIDRGAGSDDVAFREPNVVVQGLASVGVQVLGAAVVGTAMYLAIANSTDLMDAFLVLGLSMVGYGLVAPLASSYVVVAMSGNPNSSYWATYGASVLARLVTLGAVWALLQSTDSAGLVAAGMYLGVGAVAEVVVANWNHPAWRDESSAKARAQQLAPVGSGLTLASMSF